LRARPTPRPARRVDGRRGIVKTADKILTGETTGRTPPTNAVHAPVPPDATIGVRGGGTGPARVSPGWGVPAPAPREPPHRPPPGAPHTLLTRRAVDQVRRSTPQVSGWSGSPGPAASWAARTAGPGARPPRRRGRLACKQLGRACRRPAAAPPPRARPMQPQQRAARPAPRARVRPLRLTAATAATAAPPTPPRRSFEPRSPAPCGPTPARPNARVTPAPQRPRARRGGGGGARRGRAARVAPRRARRGTAPGDARAQRRRQLRVGRPALLPQVPARRGAVAVRPVGVQQRRAGAARGAPAVARPPGARAWPRMLPGLHDFALLPLPLEPARPVPLPGSALCLRMPTACPPTVRRRRAADGALFGAPPGRRRAAARAAACTLSACDAASCKSQPPRGALMAAAALRRPRSPPAALSPLVSSTQPHPPPPAATGGDGFPMVCLASPKNCGQEGQPCCYNSDPASEPGGGGLFGGCTASRGAWPRASAAGRGPAGSPLHSAAQAQRQAARRPPRQRPPLNAVLPPLPPATGEDRCTGGLTCIAEGVIPYGSYQQYQQLTGNPSATGSTSVMGTCRRLSQVRRAAGGGPRLPRHHLGCQTRPQVTRSPGRRRAPQPTPENPSGPPPSRPQADCGRLWRPCGAAASKLGCSGAALNCGAGSFCASPGDTRLGAPRCLPLPAGCGRLGQPCCPANKDGIVRERSFADKSTPVPFCEDGESMCVWANEDFRSYGTGQFPESPGEARAALFGSCRGQGKRRRQGVKGGGGQGQPGGQRGLPVLRHRAVPGVPG
jgi:hypothetical protein